MRIIYACLYITLAGCSLPTAKPVSLSENGDCVDVHFGGISEANKMYKIVIGAPASELRSLPVDPVEVLKDGNMMTYVYALDPSFRMHPRKVTVFIKEGYVVRIVYVIASS